MSWLLIMAMSAVIFFNRYVFLEPRVRIQLPRVLQSMLHYAAPCLLSAICVPVIFFEDGQQFRGLWLNAYFYAAICTAVVFILSKRLLISSIAGFLFFYLFQYFL